MGLSRRPVRLTVDHVVALRSPARECLFWELDAVRRERLSRDEAIEQKRDWVSEVLREWGACGHVLLSDAGEPVAHSLYAPAAFVGGSGAMPTAPVTPDAIQLLTVRVDPALRGGGLGRLLVRAAARDLVDRGFVALEAFGARHAPSRSGRGRDGWVSHDHHVDVLPTGFLEAVGFRTQRAHPSYPRMRMDLRTTLTWKDEVEQAIGALLGAVRPVKHPKPAPPAVRE